MIQGVEILLEQLGKKLAAGRVERLVVEDQVAHAPLITYLLFERWIEIISADEQTQLCFVDEPVLGFEMEQGLVTQIQAIQNVFPEFSNFINYRLKSISELFAPQSYSSFGVKLYFDNNRRFTLWNEDYPADENHYIFDGHIPAAVVEAPIETKSPT